MIRILVSIIFLLLYIYPSFAQENKKSVLEIVSSINGNSNEALYFYENNWKKFREVAVKKGDILSYQLGSSAPDSSGNIQIFLITNYGSADQYENSEKNFRQIIDEQGANGPKLLNELKPSDFRKRKSLDHFNNH